MKKLFFFSLVLLWGTFQCLPSAQAQDNTRFRGVNVTSNIQASDLQLLGLTWKVNLVRWQLNWNDATAYTSTSQAYDAWLENALNGLDGLLKVCETSGIKVLIDLHTTPGGRNSLHENMIFQDAQSQAKFIQVWNKIALRYKGKNVIWGYDLVNEPHQGKIPSGLMNWQQLSTRVAQNIRAVDPDHAIVVANEVDSLSSFAALPSSIPNVVYTFHFYTPWKFASQGISPNKAVLRYPGVVDKVMWNKAQLRKNMQPVIDFQKKYAARILVGEFSAVRWASAGSAYPYLKDLIDIYEQNGWDWTYHIFREYNGWSVEHTENKNDNSPSKRQTNRERLLRSWFSKNMQ